MGAVVGSRRRYANRREFLAQYFVLDQWDVMLGCEWLPRVARRVDGYVGEVARWHERTWATQGWVQPYRGRRMRTRTVNWRERPTPGHPVWGWRARIVAWSTLTGGGLRGGHLVGVGKTPWGEHRFSRNLRRALRAVARGVQPWTVGLEAWCREAIAAERAKGVQATAAAQRGRFRIRLGPRGPAVGR